MDLESRYQFLDKIGSGSFATVFRARDLELGREVAVKQIDDRYLDDPDQLERYWKEAQLLASFHHPNIVTIFDVHRERGWLILELMQANLAERMAGRPMDLRALRATLAHSLRALKYLHDRGVVHGDIKPGNLMLDARRRVKIGDFGLARRVSDDEGSLIKGTTKYMAPETVTDEFGEVGPASDLYSLGFSAYELLCGSDNFESLFPGLSAFGRNKQAAWMMWHAARDRRLPPIGRTLDGVPDDLANVVERLCEKDPARRFQTADEALEALKLESRITRPQENDEDETEEAQQPDSPDRRRLLIAGSAFAVSFLLSLVMLFWPSGSSGVSNGEGSRYGVVREVLPEQNRVVVEDFESGIPEEIQLGARPKIALTNTGQNVLLRELQPGDRVEIERNAESGSGGPISLTVSRPMSSRGVVREVDLQNDRIVLRIVDAEARDELSLRVPERAEIELNGDAARLRDLKVGDRVQVDHLHEPGTIGDRVVDSLSIRREVGAAGFIRSVDSAAGRLRVAFGRGDEAPTLNLPVGSDCAIRLESDDGPPRSLELDQLQPQDRVRFRYDVAFREIVVTRDRQQASGVVQSVEPDARQLVVQRDDGQRLTFELDEACDVTLTLEPAALADLRPYDNVDVTYDGTDPQRLVAKSVDAQRPEKHDRWAIIVSVTDFEDRFLSPLSYSVQNAGLMRETLLKRYALPRERLLMLIDRTGPEIRRELDEFLKQANRQTQVVVYVATHAYLGADNSVFLAGTDLDWDRLAETGLPLHWLTTRLDACASADKLLLLDLTHPGSGPDLKRQPSTTEMVRGLPSRPASTTVVASCLAGERGGVMPGRQLGVFAKALADGFAGPADANRDLRITGSELDDYLRRRMPEIPRRQGGEQTPVLITPEGR